MGHFQKLVVRFQELRLHPLEVADGEEEQLRLLVGHDCKLPDHAVLLVDPVVVSL